MAVILIIETGEGNPDANSYVTADYVKSYLEGRVSAIPDDSKLLPLIIQAADYMECLPRYKGQKTTQDQALQFPRKGVRVQGSLLPDTEIPSRLRAAQAQLVADMVASNKPLLNSKTEYVLKKRVLGPLSQEWATGSGQVVQGANPHPRFWSYMRDFIPTSSDGVIR